MGLRGSNCSDIGAIRGCSRSIMDQSGSIWDHIGSKCGYIWSKWLIACLSRVKVGQFGVILGHTGSNCEFSISHDRNTNS